MLCFFSFILIFLPVWLCDSGLYTAFFTGCTVFVKLQIFFPYEWIARPSAGLLLDPKDTVSHTLSQGRPPSTNSMLFWPALICLSFFSFPRFSHRVSLIFATTQPLLLHCPTATKLHVPTQSRSPSSNTQSYWPALISVLFFHPLFLIPFIFNNT